MPKSLQNAFVCPIPIFDDGIAPLVITKAYSPVASELLGVTEYKIQPSFARLADYSVLRGAKSELRLKVRTPSFIMAVPQNAQLQTYVVLASFVVRKNGNRECMIGGGGAMGSSIEFGVHKDRVVAVNIEKMTDQTPPNPMPRA